MLKKAQPESSRPVIRHLGEPRGAAGYKKTTSLTGSAPPAFTINKLAHCLGCYLNYSLGIFC